MSDYIANWTFDPEAMKDIDITAFGIADAVSDTSGFQQGDTIIFSGPYSEISGSIPFDARGLIDHPGLKRGAPMTIRYDDFGYEFHGIITGRYKQRDGTVHAWGIIET